MNWQTDTLHCIQFLSGLCYPRGIWKTASQMTIDSKGTMMVRREICFSKADFAVYEEYVYELR